MDLKTFFKEVGGDYEAVITRLPGDSLICKFVKKFVNDPSFNALKEAAEAGDIAAAFMAAHTLKGTAANLGLDNLANAASELTEKLRNADKMPDEKYLNKVEEAYNLTVDKIAFID